MKQSISKQQWDELSEEQKERFLETFNNPETLFFYDGKEKSLLTCGIGQMIEFLGEDMSRIDFGVSGIQKVSIVQGEYDSLHEWEDKELVNCLWEAVKYKLNQ